MLSIECKVFSLHIELFVEPYFSLERGLVPGANILNTKILPFIFPYNPYIYSLYCLINPIRQTPSCGSSVGFRVGPGQCEPPYVLVFGAVCSH